MEITKRLSNSGAPEVLLSELESRIGFTLPSDYRQFMREYNGGRPEPSGFVFATVDGTCDSAVRYFLTLDEGETRYTVQDFMKRYGNRIPQNMLPIACDSFGNLVLLNGGPNSAGSVCFWDHENERADELSNDNISVIAPSFLAFINALH